MRLFKYVIATAPRQTMRSRLGNRTPGGRSRTHGPWQEQRAGRRPNMRRGENLLRIGSPPRSWLPRCAGKPSRLCGISQPSRSPAWQRRLDSKNIMELRVFRRWVYCYYCTVIGSSFYLFACYYYYH